MRLQQVLIFLLIIFISACTTEVPSFSIYFETNGSPTFIPSITYDQETFELPLPPTKEDYTFDGWYFDNEAFLNPFNMNQIHTSNELDITLYAKWMPITYTITFKTYENITNDIITQGGFQTVSLGEFHSAAITTTGDLWTWGNHDYGQTGHNQNIPTNITNLFTLSEAETLERVFLGWEHTAVLTSFNQLYMFGRNDVGQLGTNTNNHLNQPINITPSFSLAPNETIVEVALGWGHSLALTSSGRLFTWGKNDSGQLGDGSNLNAFTPKDITSRLRLALNDQIILIAAGSSHSALLTKEGRLFLWGRNVYGQVGDQNNTSKNNPVEITSSFNLTTNEKIISIALGWGHSVALTSNGRLFTWGFNTFGQLGNNTQEDESQPVEITLFFTLNPNEKVISIKLGSSHSYLSTSLNRRFVWGWNQYGQLGISDFENQLIPYEWHLSFEHAIKDVFLGVYHSAVILENGRLALFGYNNEGQLGIHGIELTNQPTMLEIYQEITTETQEKEASSFPLELMTPVIEGYIFLGWYEDMTFIKLYPVNVTDKKDHTIYGLFIKTN